MRAAGMGSINIGPRTREAIRRFSVKLGKALYYRHNNEIFEGDMYVLHIAPLVRDYDPEYLATILRLSPEFATTQRSGMSLSEQFIYRFNNSKELGALFAVVQFNPQLVLQIMAIRRDTADRMPREDDPTDKRAPPIRCTLKVH